MDLVPSDSGSKFFAVNGVQVSAPDDIMSLNEANQEAEVISSLTIIEYHRLCALLLLQFRMFISTSSTVHLGAVVSYSSSFQLEDSVEIAFIRDLDVTLVGLPVRD